MNNIQPGSYSSNSFWSWGNSERFQEISRDDRHLYQWRGAHTKSNGVFFQVFAPNASQVNLVLTAFGNQEHEIPLERKEAGVWEVFTDRACPWKTYRYNIQDGWGNWKSRTDPFGVRVQETDGVCESVVTPTNSYWWNDGAWMCDRSNGSVLQKPLSIYEINVELWKKRDGRSISFSELAYEIVEYHKRFPFTHIELYGVLDHKNKNCWGYQTDHFFAVNRRMGSVDDFKYLVDLCHQNGIGVILDWVPCHYKHEHNGDASQSLYYFDGTDQVGLEHSEWDTVYFDFDKPETRRLLLASALYWLETMHVDGLRLDAVGHLLERHGHRKESAINFLKELNNVVHEQYPGILMIAEETAGFSNVTKPTWEGGLGFDTKTGIHLQKNMRYYFKTPYEQRGWDEHLYGKLLANLNEAGREEHWMLAHSHDDAAGGHSHNHGTLYGSMPTNDTWRRFADMRLFHAWNLLSPGAGHLIHMGDELGQTWPWNERLECEEGAVEWHRLGDQNHSGLLNYVGDLHRLYLAKPAFWKHADRGYQLISHDANNQVFGYRRLDYDGGRLALFYNFSPTGYTDYHFPLASLQDDPQLLYVKGAREVFNSDGVQYGGTGNFGNQYAWIQRNEAGVPTHFRFAFPPLSLVVFEELWD